MYGEYGSLVRTGRVAADESCTDPHAEQRITAPPLTHAASRATNSIEERDRLCGTGRLLGRRQENYEPLRIYISVTTTANVVVDRRYPALVPIIFQNDRALGSVRPVGKFHSAFGRGARWIPGGDTGAVGCAHSDGGNDVAIHRTYGPRLAEIPGIPTQVSDGPHHLWWRQYGQSVYASKPRCIYSGGGTAGKSPIVYGRWRIRLQRGFQWSGEYGATSLDRRSISGTNIIATRWGNDPQIVRYEEPCHPRILMGALQLFPTYGPREAAYESTRKLRAVLDRIGLQRGTDLGHPVLQRANGDRCPIGMDTAVPRSPCIPTGVDYGDPDVPGTGRAPSVQ